MLTKLWQTISQWLKGNNSESLPITSKMDKKERFLVIDDPYLTKKAKPSQTSSKTQQSLPKNAEEVMALYRQIQDLSIQQKQQKQILQDNDDFIFDLRQIDRVIKQIEKRTDNILSGARQMTHDIGHILNKIKSINYCEQQERQVYRKYTKMVLNAIQFKYSGQKVDYPLIQYDIFKQIQQIWSINENEGKNLIVEGYDHLTYSHLRLLAPTRWLNDEVITQYINQMNAKLNSRTGNTYVIFDSLKVTSLFGKADFVKLEKILNRQKINKNSIILLAIHKTNHWLFLRMQNSMISIYDSMATNIQVYLNFPLISKICKFAQHYYGVAPEIEKIQTFPQQRNNSDCGMMMLCGIKDIVRDYCNWSFSQNDINYKRVLITQELLEKKITGF